MYTEGDLPCGPVLKNQPANAGDSGSIPHQETIIPHASGAAKHTTAKEPEPYSEDPAQKKKKKIVYRQTQISAEGPLLACSWVLVSTCVWGNHPGKGKYLSEGLNPVVLMQGWGHSEHLKKK